MFTVIIAEKKHFEAIEQNSLYFKPFLDRLNDEFAFCEWFPEGETLYDCVPDLIRTVRRHRTWRAVILKDDSLALLQNPFDAIKHQRIVECEEQYQLTNPFDSSDHIEDGVSVEAESDEDSSEMFSMLEAWKKDCNIRIKNMLLEKEEIFRDAIGLPFQRLVTCLCYIPEDMPIKNNTQRADITDYVTEQLDSWNFEKYLTELDRYYHLEQTRVKNELRRECIEAMLPDDHASRRKGSMGIALPSEVLCFAERTTETGFFDAQVYWENHTDSEYSDFVGRNMYFDKMRFVASDILPKTHQDFRYDNIRFLYNFLLFSLNDAPNGTLLPRKLYCLESENNEKALTVIATTYVNKLTNSIDLVNAEIEKIKRDVPSELSDTDAEKLFCAKVIVPVLPDETASNEELFADQNDYGYFSDSFGNEAVTWRSQHRKTNESVEKLVKQPRRALKKAVDKLDRECEIDCNMIRAMNSFQMDDVRDYTESEKDKMVSMEITNIFDLSQYKEDLNEEEKKVKAVIDRRMKKKTTLTLGCVCVCLLLLTFLPLILSNKTNPNTMSTAFLLGGVAVGLLAIVLGITVILLRLPLKKALNDYNQKAKEISDDVRAAMNKYSDYLSCVCNVRRGYRVIDFSANHIDKYDREIRTRMKHLTDMEKMRAMVLDKYGDFVDEDIKCDELSCASYEYDFGREKAEYCYYPPYLPDDNIYIDYLVPGNKISLSSDFVSRITLRMEEIYD